MRKIIMIKVILVIYIQDLLKIPGNSWKELRDLVGEGILSTFAEKRWKRLRFSITRCSEKSGR